MANQLIKATPLTACRNGPTLVTMLYPVIGWKNPAGSVALAWTRVRPRRTTAGLVSAAEDLSGTQFSPYLYSNIQIHVQTHWDLVIIFMNLRSISEQMGPGGTNEWCSALETSFRRRLPAETATQHHFRNNFTFITQRTPREEYVVFRALTDTSIKQRGPGWSA